MAAVLVVDDDPKIRDLLRLYLVRDGHQVEFAADGVEALAAVAGRVPDLVLLDVMLPRIDGLEVCRRLRAQGDVPILLLTARSGDSDKVIGLDLGADDYVVKPFSPRELMARVRAHLRRRSPVIDQPVLEAADLIVDPNAMEVRLCGRPLVVTTLEFRLLHALMNRAGRVFARDELIEAIHADDNALILDRTIDVHVGRLRRKLADSAADPRYVATVRNVGYKFVAAVARGTAALDR